MVKKVVFNSAVFSPLDRSKRLNTLFALPGRPVHSDTNSASPGSILARQQLPATAKSLTFPPLSIARYSFIQLSQLGHQWRERKCPFFETVAKEDSNPDSLDCESNAELPCSTKNRWTSHANTWRPAFLSQVNMTRETMQPNGGETTWINIGGIRSARGQRKTG